MIHIPSGTKRYCGVVGWPVAHSLSPKIHNYWLDKYAIDAEYIPIPTSEDDLADTMAAIARDKCMGVNITIPHKQAVMAHLEEVDEVARIIGAVNTITVKDGKLYGHNTDAYGFLEGLRAQCEFQHHTAMVLGAGGAARAVVYALKAAGFQRILVMNRTREKAESLREISEAVQVVDWNPQLVELADVDVLVNTTALGMVGQDQLDVDISTLGDQAVVCDIVYAPLDTALLQAARARGLQTADGLGMLLYQAQKAFYVWHQVMPVVDEALRNLLIDYLEAA